LNAVQVAGWGLWTPGYGSASDWVARREDPALTGPKPRMLNSRIGRYTSQHTRLALQVLEQAANHAAFDLSTVATVYGSVYGEIQIAFEQMDMIREEGVASPARFKNSVHNTAGGHGAIACGNHNFSTAIAAGSATFAMSLLEAWGWLDAHGGEAIVVVADEKPPEHLDKIKDHEPLGVAIALQAGSTAGGEAPRLAALAVRQDLQEPPRPAGWVDNPCDAALHLVDALERRRAGIVPVEVGGDGWSVEVEFA